MRVLFWVQHLLGSGHLRRTLAIARACAERGLEVVVASGGVPMPWPSPDGVRLEQLPSIRAADATFRRLVTASGQEVGAELWAQRRDHLAALVDERPPDVLVTEMFPFGRRSCRHEVTALLQTARERNPECGFVASVRDILVTKSDNQKLDWMLACCRAWYDKILVHGDPRILPFEATFPHAREIMDRIIYTGFVHVGEVPQPRDREEVVVSAGGGIAGAGLMEAAVAARQLSKLRVTRWRLITGANCGDELFSRLAAVQDDTLVVERHRNDMMDVLAGATVSVSQAGYNTVIDCVVSGTLMVLVPFAEEGEDEQTIRADRLAELGLAVVLDPRQLEPRTLAEAVDAAALRSPAALKSLAVDGAERSAYSILQVAGSVRRG